MEKKEKMTLIRRIAAGMLALLMAAAYMPLIGSSVFAEEEMIRLNEEQAESLGIKLEDGKDYSGGIYISKKDAEKAHFDTETELTDEPDEPELAESKTESINETDLTKIPVVHEENSEAGLKLNGSGTEDPETAYADQFQELTTFLTSNAAQIMPGEQKACNISSVGANGLYQFTPQQDGYYFFYSSDKENVDPVGRIVYWDSERNAFRQLRADDDSQGDSNFRVDFFGRAGTTYYLQAVDYSNDDTGTMTVHLEKDDFNASITASLDKASGIATVTGTATGGDTFYDIYVDGERCYADTVSDQSSFTARIDMKEYPVGIHEIYATLNGHSAVIYAEDAIPTYIYGKPSIKYDEFYSTYKYLAYYYSGSRYSHDSDCDVYVQWKKKGGSWNKTLVGPISTNSGLRNILNSNLKASTNYVVRTVYGKMVSYGGEDYFISGIDTGKYSSSKTIKTAGKKPSIKSVKIYSVKVKSTKVRQPVYNGYWIGTMYYTYLAGYRTVKVYQTKFKIKVNLKKKPGASYFYIGSKRIKENKKSYKANFTLGGKYKGKRLTFEFVSQQSKKYTSYSPIAKKKVRIK